MRVGEDACEGPEWDALVRRSEGWTQFHLFGWKRIIEAAFGHECLYLSAADDAGLAGVLPLVRVKSRLFGHYLVSMPFVNYGGPLGCSAAVQALVQAAVRRADREGVRLLELRSRRTLEVPLQVSHRKVTVVRDLPPGDPEQLWKELRAKVRSQVRRPRKEGIEVRFGPDQVAPFCSVYRRHMRDLGTPAQGLALFELIQETFPDDVWFGCAYDGSRPVAAGCGFVWDGEFEMTWASALRAYSRVAPNMLLYWRFMERAAQRGLRLFNFGRCTPGGGTHRFKRQWGSRDEPLWWYYRASGRRASTPSPDEAAYAWGPRLWRRLPLPVANILGPRIVRYIP
ncbi:MAG: FemAB family XrtA/PEP-CTERM system-associated protein [Gemmatimonadota bacterium]